MHPSEVARELSSFVFFKSFSEDLLLQIATMVKPRSVGSGEYLLKEGLHNNSLFFLRKGEIQVQLGGEVIATLRTLGDVMGEMSVISHNPAATSLFVSQPSEVFELCSDDFGYVHPKDKDHFQALLYRIYSVILIERLMKTNEKARLFEILNKELNDVQNSLNQGKGGEVLLVEADKKKQVLSKLALGGTRVNLTIAGDSEKLKESTSSDKVYDVVIADDQFCADLKTLHQAKKAKHYVLATGQTVRTNIDIIRTLPFVNNIVTRTSDDKNENVKATLITLTKVLNQDIFGLEKYLGWGVAVENVPILDSKSRDALKENMCAYFKAMGVRSSIVDRMNTVAEELLMNAIYDAPVDGTGKSLFNHLSRKTEVKLDTHQQSQFRYAGDGITLAISVVDPFGRLTKEIVLDYLQSCYDGQAGSLNHGKGGAGRGLHQIIENADLTIFNVKHGVRTEVISLFYTDHPQKESDPGFHFFFVP